MGMGVLKALARLGGAASLSQEGLVAQDPSTQHYYLGREAIQIGLAALRQADPIRLGEPALIRLREELKVTCFIAVMGNKGPTVLRFEEPGLPVTINVRAGSVLPMLWSATGQVFLSYMDDLALVALADEEFVSGSKEQRASLHGKNPIEQLRKKVRKNGCAVINDTMLRGISAVAAPIFDYTGKLTAVLTALGATGGFDASADGVIATHVMRKASDISAALGFSA